MPLWIHQKDIPWESAVLAGLIHCHACILRELHDVPLSMFREILYVKQGFWEALATVSFPNLIAEYNSAPFLTRNLLLNMMLNASQAQENTRDFYSSQGEFISMRRRTELIVQMPRGQYPEMEQLLNNDEIKAVYMTICRTRANRLNDAMYHSAIKNFLSNLYATNLHRTLGIYGTTMTCKQVIIDTSVPPNVEHFNVLMRSYRIVIMLHEFAHLLIRVHTNNVRDFLQTTTPEKDPNMTPSPQERTPVRSLIGEHFPFSEHGEAGYILEKQLFAKDLFYINASAAAVLLEMAAHPKPLTSFQTEFNSALDLPDQVSPRMQLGRSGRAGRDVMFFGRCGILSPAL